MASRAKPRADPRSVAGELHPVEEIDRRLAPPRILMRSVFFYVSPSKSFDRSSMNRYPQVVLQVVYQLGVGHVGLLFDLLQQESLSLFRKLVALFRAPLAFGEADYTPFDKRVLRFVKRLARESELQAYLRYGLSIDVVRSEHLVFHLHLVDRVEEVALCKRWPLDSAGAFVPRTRLAQELSLL